MEGVMKMSEKVANFRLEVVGEIKPFKPKHLSQTKFFSVAVIQPQYEKRGEFFVKAPDKKYELVFTDMFLSSAFMIQKGVWLEVTGVINEGSDGVVRISAEKISLPLDQERLHRLFIRNEVKNGY